MPARLGAYPSAARAPVSQGTPAWLGGLAANRWLRAAAIVLLGCAAQEGCLHAVTWYLDDTWQVHDSEYVEGGLWWQDPAVLLTNLSYYVTWRLAGFSTVAFHLGNLGIHLALALSVYWLGRHLFALCGGAPPAAWETPSWLAAVLFAVHPLTTEVTHYIRARDHGLVALFSFLAAGFAAMAIRRNARWWAAVIGAVVLAAFSKGPGLPHALLCVGLVVLAAITSIPAISAIPAGKSWRLLLPGRRYLLLGLLAVLCATAAVWAQIVLLETFFIREISGRRFFLHALTQARVLPQYLWRMVVPIHLCSDHLFAWTKNFSDSVAWLWLAVSAGLLLGIVVLWVRRVQPWALLLALALTALWLRWLYAVSELMVEYRTYPAMPWVAMLFALAIWRCWDRWPAAARIGFAGIVCTFILLCRARSRDWQSSEALHSQILRLYPLQLRAFNGLSNDDLREGRYQAVVDRNPEFERRLQVVLAMNRRDPHRYLENWPLWAVCEECMYGEAIAHVGNTYSAMDQLDMTAWRMNENHIFDAVLWAQWHLSVANVLLLRGDKQDALREYRLLEPSIALRVRVDREIQKILAPQPR